MKKIAFTVAGSDLSAKLDPRFGRAQQFLIYNLEAQTFDVLDNSQGRGSAQGAGIQAAETMVKMGIDSLITGHCGPKAFRVLEAAGITVYNCSAHTVQEALDMLIAGKLQPAEAADKGGHW
jgi:predicted Fe-Mo cluster-binding NifX family protein